jgi:hypothetical protein
MYISSSILFLGPFLDCGKSQYIPWLHPNHSFDFFQSSHINRFLFQPLIVSLILVSNRAGMFRHLFFSTSSSHQTSCTYIVHFRANYPSIISCKCIHLTILPFINRKEVLALSKTKPHPKLSSPHSHLQSEKSHIIASFFSYSIKEVESHARACMRRENSLQYSFTFALSINVRPYVARNPT